MKHLLSRIQVEETKHSPAMGRLALRVCRDGSSGNSSRAERGTLGHFTVLFITSEDMSPGISHTRTSTHAHTRAHTHASGIPNSQAEEQLSMTGHILHTANGPLGNILLRVRARVPTIIKTLH